MTEPRPAATAPTSTPQPSAETLREGYWFSIPLDGERVALACLSRVAPGRGVGFGYFYGPFPRSAPVADLVGGLRPGDAALRARFSTDALEDNRWVLVKSDPNFSRSAWPLPRARAGLRSDAVYDDDTLELQQIVPSSEDAGGERLDEDTFWGSEALENVLRARATPAT